MFDKRQFAQLVKEVLVALGLYSPAACSLILGTVAQESAFGTYLNQLGGGPGLGVCQMEPATAFDIWLNYLAYRPARTKALTRYTGVDRPGTPHLEFNLAYQIAMARIHYRRIKEPLPAANDPVGQAHYWKNHYNTSKGRGTVEEFLANFQRYLS